MSYNNWFPGGQRVRLKKRTTIGKFINHNKRYYDTKVDVFQFITNVQIRARISRRAQ